MRKEINIKIPTPIPEGYKIDEKASTFECIVLKKIENKLPSTWKELGKINGVYIDSSSRVFKVTSSNITSNADKNIFPTKEQAQALITLAQLLQLREVYRDGWKPNWKNENVKYCITTNMCNWKQKNFIYIGQTFSFQSEKIRHLFFTNFKDLLEEVKPLFI